MSPITPEQKPSGPDGKPSQKGIEIPVWWSLIVLALAALVYLPILYADTHAAKPAAQEESQPAQKAAEVQPDTKVAASSETEQPKVAAKEAEPAEPAKPAPAEVTPPKQEPAKVEPAKPAAAAEVAPPKEEPAKAEPAKPAAAEVTEPKEVPAKAEPAKPEPAKSEPAKSAAAEAVQPKAEPEKAAAAEATQKQAEEKPAATVTAQSQNEAAQAAKPQEGQKVALTKPAEKLKVGGDTIFYRIDGVDKEGRAAAFDFITLTNDYKWALGSSSRVVSSGKLIPESQTANRILAPKVRDALANVTDVIGVGLASQDGKRADEEARALARSKTAAAWIKQAAKPGIGLWTLSLGQYDSKDCKKKEDSDSSFDRPVLFVSVRSKAEGVNLQQALADAISGHNNLPSQDCYSRFDLEKVQ